LGSAGLVRSDAAAAVVAISSVGRGSSAAALRFERLTGAEGAEGMAAGWRLGPWVG
jgi:hypothetical protein